MEGTTKDFSGVNSIVVAAINQVSNSTHVCPTNENKTDNNYTTKLIKKARAMLGLEHSNNQSDKIPL